MRAELAAIPGVVDVHDLHVWTLTSDMEVATAHVMVGADIDHHGVLDQARDLLASHHGIEPRHVAGGAGRSHGLPRRRLVIVRRSTS